MKMAGQPGFSPARSLVLQGCTHHFDRSGGGKGIEGGDIGLRRPILVTKNKNVLPRP